jgi:hypothetical protein
MTKKSTHTPGTFQTPNSNFVLRCHYPKENSDEIVDEIVRGLHYIGIFGEKPSQEKNERS